MDESLLGMRVLDVLRGVDYALGRDDVDRRGLRAVGMGRGATWLLFAAALDPRVQALVCDSGLLSYKSLVQTDRYLYGGDMFALGLLKRFDLPHVAAAMADRPLALISPVGPMKQPLTSWKPERRMNGRAGLMPGCGRAAACSSRRANQSFQRRRSICVRWTPEPARDAVERPK